MDTYNFTVIELSKVPFFIEAGSSSIRKWLFFFRYLDKLKELPAELDERKFESLTESSKVSKFSKEEFEAYQKMFHEKWDHNVLKDSFFEEFADEINAKVAEGVLDKTREMAKTMREQGIPDSTIAVVSGLSEEEIRKL